MKKNVLDTNVLLEGGFNPVLESLTEPTHIIIPLVVLEELDTFKKGFEAKNEYARATTRFLDSLRKLGKLHEGVQYGEHIIQVMIKEEELDLNKPDYKIILTAKENEATLVTQDINERVVADAVGVDSEGFAASEVDVNKLYTGYMEFDITSEEVQAIYEKGEFNPGDRGLLHNQFAIMTDDFDGVHLGIYKADTKRIHKLLPNYQAWGVKPKKDKQGQVVIEQIFLLHLLLDPDIECVTAIGPSGCGKTLLSLAAALEQSVNKDTYSRTMVMRPLVPVGDDIGYLPGDKLEKLEPWMASTFDSLEYLLEEHQMKDGSFATSSREKIHNMISVGQLELEAMAHVRGRSIPKQFIIVDDAQNLTQQQATTIVTRAGEGTKLILLGDLSEKQIDNHRLTPNSNGLAYVIDRFKGQDIVGHITLQTVVRSRLAQLGVELL